MELPYPVGIPAAEMRRGLGLQILSYCDSVRNKVRHRFLNEELISFQNEAIPILVCLLSSDAPGNPLCCHQAALASRGVEQVLPSFVHSKCETDIWLDSPERGSKRVSVMVLISFQI